MVGVNPTTFAKTICSICFEDLKPIVEDLQSISICGHVFHELCLQQWFEYCKNGKKKSCPVCKQTCSNANVGRLYFQSIGDSNDFIFSQKSSDYEETPEELRNEVKRLEGKVTRLSSVLEEKQKNFEAVNAELLVYKERFKIEVALKDEALKQRATVEQLLRLKSKELDSSILECKRLQERNLALAKELAALKLVSDLDLEEDEVLKFASLGNEANSKETVDVLKKSLVIRNKSYKELMTKCNILGRGEARFLNKLEKAKEKIKRLKERIQDLESAVEVKENKVLRTLKASKDATYIVNILNSSDQRSKNGECSNKNQNKEPANVKTDIAQAESMPDNLSSSRKKRKLESLDVTSNVNAVDKMVFRKLEQDNQAKGPFLVNEYAGTPEVCIPKFSYQHLKPLTESGVAVWKCLSGAGDRESETQAQGGCNKDGVSGPAGPTKSNIVDVPASMDDMVIAPYDDMTLSPFLPNVRNETRAAAIVSQPGDRCFSGGLLGPDGTNWHLGKWCKRVHNKGQELQPAGLQGSTARTGDLIAVGADGRGGRIKVLRSLNQSSLDNKENLTCTRKYKIGAKASTLQSQGCLQIEHFFGRAGQS